VNRASRRAVRVLAVTAAAVLSVPVGLAVAAPPSAPAAAVLTSSRVTGAQVQRAASTSTQDTRGAVRQHVAGQAREGRLVDAKNVRSAAVAGGLVTWERGSKVDELRSDRRTSAEESGTSEALGLTLIGSEDQADRFVPPATVGAGMTGSSSMSGGRRLANYCQTWTSAGNSVTACVEKFDPTNDGSSTRDYYAYNRWGTASGKIVDWAPDWKVTKFDMRSRPHASYASRTKGMNDYFPNDSAQLCNEGGSAQVGLGSLSFSIGLTDCSDKYPIPNATTKTMGLIYDAGAIFGDRVRGLDYSQEVWTYQGYATTSLGFYNYGKFCQGSYANCNATLGKDGW
jgi:hypothetical protein